MHDDKSHVVGWKLDRTERENLLERLPHWPDAIADHVALKSKVGEAAPLPIELIPARLDRSW